MKEVLLRIVECHFLMARVKLAEEQVLSDYDIPEVTVMHKHLVIYVAK